MLNIALRADGGKNVGMGHVMRCLSLAKAFRRNGHNVCFFSKLDEGIEKVGSERFEVVRMPSVEQRDTEGFFYGDPARLAEEAKVIIALVKRYQIDVLMIDSYNVTEEYFLALKSQVRSLAYIDDVNKFSYPADIVINGNITGKYLGYTKYHENQVLLLGPEYNMIRGEFCNLPARMINENAAEIMITTGGSDPYNTTGKLITILSQQEQCKNLRLNVLVGGGFANIADLIKLKQKYAAVFLYKNSALPYDSPEIRYSEVADIMLRSDVAIAAGGSTLYELAACGTPAMAFILADNQEFIVHKMDELGYVQSIGWHNQWEQQQVVKTLCNLLSNYEQRKAMSRQGQRLVDGQGTERIVHNIIQYLR
jgi:UDP-2,4-diacetamido-2,4,6-trideoxy-beta-L-altropyranose hydrolase